MTESILDWMKKTDSRFNPPLPRSDLNQKPEPDYEKSMKSTAKKGTLDQYVPSSPNSELFDNHFNRRDFRKVTQQWQDDNLVKE